ncbi:WhiB family transcriptional regulator [Mycobacterium sp. SMC-4]|uniref:WhiB family transcriptional regulator n=1 Tax=Mycobacterium sp. SMC-4 TaxID=2857059 RepID=UPI002208AE62|nr:WhiB family transcriptional regulator [Mycobacterium sp. SMC-4]UXA17597.1 WhiB family transcriptional regulator [Mycobacterium sp. SMC-4]
MNGAGRFAHAQTWRWRRHARCLDLPTDLFFVSEQHRGAGRAAWEERAKQICLNCTVRRQCLMHALETREPHGIWGATTPGERARMVARRDQENPNSLPSGRDSSTLSRSSHGSSCHSWNGSS